MNKTSIAVAVAAFLSVGVSTTLWADSMSKSNDSNMMNQATRMSNTAVIEPMAYQGKEVITSNGDSVGTIDKLVTSNRDHSVFAVVGVGGFLGIAEKDVAIPIYQLQSQGDKWLLSSSITEDSLKEGMTYAKSEFSAYEPNAAAIEPRDYTGKEIITSKGDSVGKIDKLVTSNRDHTVYAVVGVGGMLGLGEKDIAIPINQLQSRGDKWLLNSSVTKDSLKQEMKYEKSEFSAFESIDQPSGD